MKINCIGENIVNTAKIITSFGSASLVQTGKGRHELIGGTADDFTAAKEWASLFAHDIVFRSPANQTTANN